MKRSTFSKEQIAYGLDEVDAGRPVAGVCRQLESENSRLKRLVADLTLDKHMLWERWEKISSAPLCKALLTIVPATMYPAYVWSVSAPGHEGKSRVWSYRVTLASCRRFFRRTANPPSNG